MRKTEFEFGLDNVQMPSVLQEGKHYRCISNIIKDLKFRIECKSKLPFTRKSFSHTDTHSIKVFLNENL